MYTGIVCLVLFDARGNMTDQYEILAIALIILMMGMKYIPNIFHRPNRVELFCEDLLHISTHASCVAAFPLGHNNLRYACALHCTCFILQQRFLKHGNPVLVHTITFAWLICAYVYGPRVSELKTFIAAVACPHILDAIATLVVQIHKFAVLWLMEF
jgi:hypothetical protein